MQLSNSECEEKSSILQFDPPYYGEEILEIIAYNNC